MTHREEYIVTKTLPITKARYKLKDLSKEFAREKEPEAVAVTRRGEPILAVMPWDLYESLIETLEIMGDKDLMEGLQQSIREIKEGKTIPWEEAKNDLGLEG